MNDRAGRREETKARLTAAAGRGFRRNGYGGIGVDGLAKEAMVTSGAFYGHFPSKEAAFTQVVAAGLEELRAGLATMRRDFGDGWPEPFVAFYLGLKRTCDLGESCAMQSLASEVARCGPEARLVFETGLRRVAEEVEAGLPQGSPTERRAAAWAFLSILAGGVTLARTTSDPALAEEIAASVAPAALSILAPYR
ncbi:MAG: TetR/AcrR family transcriptional regulator [Hyphomicrobiales bacterium]|nr:TetR/AcrR family transcriptional regulator [Hyphomicrobiales bacterium]